MRSAISISSLIVLAMFTLPLLADKDAKDKASTAKKSSEKSPDKRSSDSKNSSEAKKRAARKSVPLPEREAAALTFVRKHHDDLGQLLVYLKENNPGAYRQAILDLYRTSQRLAQYHDRGDNERYNLELKVWQARSRIQLIVANMKMGQSDDLKAQLKDALREQIELKVQILQHDRQRWAERIAKLDEQLDQLTKDRESEIDKQVRLLTRSTVSKTKTPPRSIKKTTASVDSRKKSQTKK